jgi:hypothetical protein
MMRALKAVALLVFVAGVVAAIVLIAAWPLGAVPTPGTAAGDDGQPRAVAGAGDGQPGAVPQGGGPVVTVDPLPGADPRTSARTNDDAAAPDTRADRAPAGGSSTPGGRPATRLPVRSSGPAPDPRSTERQQGVPTTRRLLPRSIVGRADPEPTSGGLAKSVRVSADEGVGLSVIAIDRRTGQVIAQADPDRLLPSMSLVKLFIAVDLLDAAGGPQNLDQETAATLWRMITVSDDDAASRLWVAGGAGAIVDRAVQRFHLSGVRPPNDPRMWGDTTITARDIANFLRQALADPAAGPWLMSAMQSAQDLGADGFDQNFGMNTIAGAGSKQGWGCCLRGVRSLDSAGFTDDLVVVALGYAAPVVDDATMRSELTATVGALLH